MMFQDSSWCFGSIKLGMQASHGSVNEDVRTLRAIRGAFAIFIAIQCTRRVARSAAEPVEDSERPPMPRSFHPKMLASFTSAWRCHAGEVCVMIPPIGL